MNCVLLIDDDSVGLHVRACLLRSAGYKVLSAETGLSGAELALKDCVDLVVLDYRLPDMAGADVLRRIHAVRPSLPVVFLSGVLGIPEGEAEGATAILVKGDGPEGLLATIARHAPARMAA